MRKYKFLYDPLHQHYKNNALRTKVWDKITESLGSSKDRKKIMIKWKNLKKKFMDVKLQRPRLPAKNQQLFLDSMQFILPYYNAQALDESVEAISSDVFEPYPHERDTLRLVSEDIWFEDSFIDEIKKHPELYDSSLLSTSNADKKKIWADIAEIFQESG